MCGCHVFVVSRNGSVAASGGGDLWVTGAGVANGYFAQPELTAQSFLRRWPSTEIIYHDVALQCPIFKTGDIGTILVTYCCLGGMIGLSNCMVSVWRLRRCFRMC